MCMFVTQPGAEQSVSNSNNIVDDNENDGDDGGDDGDGDEIIDLPAKKTWGGR